MDEACRFIETEIEYDFNITDAFLLDTKVCVVLNSRIRIKVIEFIHEILVIQAQQSHTPGYRSLETVGLMKSSSLLFNFILFQSLLGQGEQIRKFGNLDQICGGTLDGERGNFILSTLDY
jgi:hypothetical protein